LPQAEDDAAAGVAGIEVLWVGLMKDRLCGPRKKDVPLFVIPSEARNLSFFS
jgi:hypothetical protein